MIGGRLGLAYHAYIVTTAPGATGLADLVAFFLRRAFMLLGPDGTFGLLATNTIAQGDTRNTSLGYIVRNGGAIYSARRRYRWPGEAAVIVSVIHVKKGGVSIAPRLDDNPVHRISAFLLPGDEDSTPAALPQNRGRGYVGGKVWGAGFVFEENASNGSSSLDDLRRLIRDDPRVRERIFAFMGGEEFNASPTQSANRFVIDFGEMSEEQARTYPSLFRIVEERVRPVRAVNKQRNYRDNWWLHVTRAPEASEYIRVSGRIIALAKVSARFGVAFVGGGTVLADTMMLILMHEDWAFAVVQSAIHESWARLTGSSMKDDLRYTTDCFDTFPFPNGETGAEMDVAGRRYHEFRAALMVKNNEGLTKTYNRFHDPEERSLDVLKLRELHAQMDRAVLDAYGWSDIKPVYDFREQLDESIRLTWADDVRDEVLARLLELNRVRAEDESKAAPKTDAKVPKKTAKKKSESAESTRTLFPEEDR